MPSSAMTALPMTVTVLTEAGQPECGSRRQQKTMSPVGSSRRSLQVCMSVALARSQTVRRAVSAHRVERTG
jgi:hypothetical protein